MTLRCSGNKKKQLSSHLPLQKKRAPYGRSCNTCRLASPIAKQNLEQIPMNTAQQWGWDREMRKKVSDEGRKIATGQGRGTDPLRRNEGGEIEWLWITIYLYRCDCKLVVLMLSDSKRNAHICHFSANSFLSRNLRISITTHFDKTCHI